MSHTTISFAELNAMKAALLDAQTACAELKGQVDRGVAKVGEVELECAGGASESVVRGDIPVQGGKKAGAVGNGVALSDMSWSDEMDEVLSSASESSVTMPEKRSIGGEVRGLVFGGPVTESFYAQYVKIAEVKALDKWLRAAGVKVSKRWMEELALARCAQGNVPTAFLRGRERLRTLAKVGDNVMLLLLTDQMYFSGEAVASVQDCCSRVLSRNMLSKAGVGSGFSQFVSYPAGVDRLMAATTGEAVEAVAGVGSGFSQFVSYPAGVDRLMAATTGEAVEAVAGVVYHSQGIEGVRAYMKHLQLLN